MLTSRRAQTRPVCSALQPWRALDWLGLVLGTWRRLPIALARLTRRGLDRLIGRGLDL
jgi:hypothetical protein